MVRSLVAAMVRTTVEGKTRVRGTKRTTLINIHDEIYPSIITGPEIYARTTVSDRRTAEAVESAPKTCKVY